MMRRLALCSMAATCVAFAAKAEVRCDEVLERLGDRLADATCVASVDLTTTNEATTPLNNTLAGLPPLAWVPRTDRSVIAPTVPHPPITVPVPGLQIQARIAGDPTGEARFLLRLPDNWNGRLVVAGASGTRSEFNGDFAWSDYVLQQGFAYASQNKGVYNLRLAGISATQPASDPLSCRLNPVSKVWVHFYDNDPGQPFTRWAEFMVTAGRLAREGVEARYGQEPRRTYAVGTSNGGYQVRRAIETAPEVFDGGVDWEGTYVDAHAPNLLTDLPAALLNYGDYAAGGFKADSTAAKNLLAAGYPPDIVNADGKSLWRLYWEQFWEVTQCQWQKRLDPSYDTYGAGLANYNYVARLAVSDVGTQLSAFATTGRIHRPLITVAGTMDALLPIDHHARAYERAVEAARVQADDDEGDDRGRPVYRLYEVQNGNHLEAFKDTFPQLEHLQPSAQRAFDLLVDYVENHQPLPASQCVPRGGSISGSPAQPGHCAKLFVP